jgi:ClpP class serine protease
MRATRTNRLRHAPSTGPSWRGNRTAQEGIGLPETQVIGIDTSHEKRGGMSRRSVLRGSLTVAGLVLVLVVGYLLSLYLIPTPQVAVIQIQGDIWGMYTRYLRNALEEAGKDPAVRAVVIDISSPGGEVTASEDLYFQVLKLREAKPVVASIGEMAASGAYYIAAAADPIYAKPGSSVGNIGVISFLPEPDQLDEQLYTTGPFKLSGGPQVAAIRQLELLKDTFLLAIQSQRETRLQVSPDVLSRGEIYLGLQAEKMGLVDELGSLGDATAAAARLAGLRNYNVVDRSPELPEELAIFGFKQDRVVTAASLAAMPGQMPPGFYYRYVEPNQ